MSDPNGLEPHDPSGGVAVNVARAGDGDGDESKLAAPLLSSEVRRAAHGRTEAGRHYGSAVVLFGAALILGYIAWLHRRGPDTLGPAAMATLLLALSCAAACSSAPDWKAEDQHGRVAEGVRSMLREAERYEQLRTELEAKGLMGATQSCNPWMFPDGHQGPFYGEIEAMVAERLEELRGRVEVAANALTEQISPEADGRLGEVLEAIVAYTKVLADEPGASSAENSMRAPAMGEEIVPPASLHDLQQAICAAALKLEPAVEDTSVAETVGVRGEQRAPALTLQELDARGGADGGATPAGSPEPDGEVCGV